MSETRPFIGRIEELDQIDALIEAWGTRRVVCIHGDGGVGKTRLMEEVRSRQVAASGPRLLLTDIIDYDDRALHVPENIEQRILAELDEQALNTYLRRLLDLHRMQIAGVSSEELGEQNEQVHRTLAEQLNHISAERRVVLFLDTMEKLEDTEVWDRLTDLIESSENTLFVMAGRQLETLYNLLEDKIGSEAKLIKLAPLTSGDSREYLEQKQRDLHVNLDPKLTQRLLDLSEGRPILIDLAVEWLSRNVPMSWLMEDGPVPIEHTEDFQSRLVEHIGKVRSPMDRLTLVLSRFYPLDEEMISGMLAIPLDSARSLLEQAKTYVFVKSLPDGKIHLHDEMRRMVREYVWPKIDEQEGRRREDSQLALQYLTKQAESLSSAIQAHGTAEEVARKEENAEQELASFIARKTAEQQLWAIREQQLYHTLFTDIAAGLEVFTTTFDQATQTYYYSFRELLLAEMQKYFERLSPGQQYEVWIRRTKYWLDSGQYESARDLIREKLDDTALLPAQQTDTLIQYANVEIRMGEFQRGIELFTEAVRVSREAGLKDWLAKAETGLGWAYRLVSDLQRAGVHYQIALDLAIEIGSKHQQALLYNNLGFLYVYYAHIPGNSEKAMWFCTRALELWTELDDRRGEGRSYSTLGCVRFMCGDFESALTYFRRALDIFEPAHDREWLSLVYSWRGAVYLSLQRLDLAKQDIERSLEMNVDRDRPMNLSRLGLIYILTGDLEAAQKAVQECRRISLAWHNVWYQLISLRDMARLARHRREFDQLEDLESELAEYGAQWQSQDRRALGMLYLNLGALALGQNDLDKAVDYWGRGLRPLAEQGRYGSDTTEVHMERLEKIMVDELALPVEQIREIGVRLLAFWREEKLDFDYPDVRILLARWAKWGAD